MSTAPHYCLPTAGDSKWGVLIHERALVRPLTREQFQTLNRRVKCYDVGIFGANRFCLGELCAERVAPDCGPVRGWGRWPGADHWHVTRGGKTVFRSQSYPFVLRYFFSAANKSTK